MNEDIRPFHLAIPEEEIVDLRRRLDATRWPDAQTVPDGAQGAPLDRVKALVDYWRSSYDWRRCETKLNGFGQFKTDIDGLEIHFLHIRSQHGNALPMILTHGWPGSVLEFHKIIAPLTDPTAHGGRAEDAFHLVIPSLPGHGFSGKPEGPGWGLPRIARAWAALMKRLGYHHYVAQGGDWGAAVTTHMADIRPPELVAINLNLPILFPPPASSENPTDEELAAFDDLTKFGTDGSGYSSIQSTRPQTLGYGLADSPAGQAAWIYEKLSEWSDSGNHAENVFSRDEIIDNIMLYWLPNAAASSARLYWESLHKDFHRLEIAIPVGCSIFKGDNFHPPRLWAERTYSDLFYWNEVERGGHLAAFEQPEAFVAEMRACFAVTGRNNL